MKRHDPGLSWPRMDQTPMQVACHYCDCLQTTPRLHEYEAALCKKCGEVISQNRPRSLARATGFCTAGLIFMLLAHGFPFLVLDSGNSRTFLTLSGAAESLARDGDSLLAAGIVISTIIAPLGLVGGLLYVTGPLRFGMALPGAVTVARWFHWFEPWSMLEVFLVGLLVSLLKLGHAGEVRFGIGLWALAGLVICTAAAVAAIDKMELWDRLEIALQPDPEPLPDPEADPENCPEAPCPP